jgi:hypothetical protein
MKTKHELFFAIPFDSATKNLYERVCLAIRRRYPMVTTVIGNQEVGPSPAYSTIATFKAQNRELTKQFVEEINKADIIIADLTHNNANVHVELGIALRENKNILRVTGRSVSELGFDIRNLEVYQYKNEKQLKEKIFAYLDMFFQIKQLNISQEYPLLYCVEPMPLKLRAVEKQFDMQSNCPSDYMMRDGAVRIDFEILKAQTPDDWFGIFFRAGANPLIGSHLVYVRQSGIIELATYPGPRILSTSLNGQLIKGKKTLTVEFENDYLSAQIDNVKLITEKLSYQVPGRVLQAAWRADVDISLVEMICRDTIEW